MLVNALSVYLAFASLVLSAYVPVRRSYADTFSGTHLLLPRVDALNIECTDANAKIDTHNKNVALLQICGGIAGSIQKCQGAPKTTTGQSGDAKFTLTPTDSGATINVSKGRWEQCIKSAEKVCPGGQAYTATCPGGASKGDINFELAKQ